MSARVLFGLCIAVSFDVAMGLLVVYWLSISLRHSIYLISYGMAIILVLLPDFDVIVQKIDEGKITGMHKKNMSHYLLIMIPIISIVLLLFSSFWSLVGALCLIIHYIHDTLEEGPGIPWFAPFYSQRYLLRKRVDGWRFRLTNNELSVLYADVMEEWLERDYLHITPKSVLGVATLFVVLILIFFCV